MDICRSRCYINGQKSAILIGHHQSVEPEEIYFRYYLKFDTDWKQATSGGKLPGISGTYGLAGWGGRPVHGNDGWSARGLYLTKNGGTATDIGFYCYHADMRGEYGDDLKFKTPLEHGKWYCVELYCKLNTPGRRGHQGQERRHLAGLARRCSGLRENGPSFSRCGHAQD